MSEVVYRINRPEVIHEQFEDEYVIVNLKTGSYYSLSGSAPIIWDAIANGATGSEIVQAVSTAFTGENSSIQAGVQEILTAMESEGLVVADPTLQDSRPARTASEDRVPRPLFSKPVLEKYTDMQELLLLDPIHQVDESGWPSKLPDAQ